MAISACDVQRAYTQARTGIDATSAAAHRDAVSAKADAMIGELMGAARGGSNRVTARLQDGDPYKCDVFVELERRGFAVNRAGSGYVDVTVRGCG